MKFSSLIILLILITISFSQCSKETIDVNVNVPEIADTVFYDTDIKPIINTHCIGCHSGANPSAGADLSTYELVKFQSEFGTLINRINDSQFPMPTSGLMSTENRGKFDKWVSDGFLETE
tara:strand:- start:149 stop:508 length:360 start_codon:yes stop_codon:yes gene_type:complete